MSSDSPTDFGRRSRSISDVSTPLLHDSLMRERKNQDPYKFYEVVTVLGEGSMGSVSKVKKRAEATGGTARPSFFEYMQRGESFFHKVGKCWDWCFGKIEESERNCNLDLLLSPPSASLSGQSDSESLTNDTNHSAISTMIRFGHRDTFYALKSIHLNQARNTILREELKNEVEILKTVDHPNIVTAVETFEWRNDLYLVLELCSGGDLYTRDPYTEPEAARISLSILNAVAYLHYRGISHRDLKYENIMFVSPSPNADVKIIDFGLSKKYGSSEAMMHDAVGTVYSMSPEVLRGKYTNKADVWSCGVLTFMLLSSTMPFYGKTRRSVMRHITKGTYTFKGPKWDTVSEDAKLFVERLLKYDPADRPTASEAAHDRWLQMMRRGRRASISSIPEAMDAVQASMESFAGYNTLKRLALMVVAHKSTSEEIGFLRRMFKKYDDDKGFVTLQGFKQALHEYEYTDEEVERIFKAIDIDRTGKVHYFEFLAATIESHGYINEERLAEAFDRLDSDDCGYITVDDLRSFLGEEVPQQYIDRIIAEADISQDRMVDYDEFLQMWNIQTDEARKKTREHVTRRRFNQAASRDTPSSFCSDSDVDMSGLSSEECEHEDGDFTFQFRKDASIRASIRSSSASQQYAPSPLWHARDQSPPVPLPEPFSTC